MRSSESINYQIWFLFFCNKRSPRAVSTLEEMFWTVVTLQLSSADEDFHTFSGTFCHVFIGFFPIQTFCLFLGPVSHLHHLTPSSLLTTCHTDRCSTYSTKALVSRFIFMYNSEPVLTLYPHFSFALCLYLELEPKPQGVIMTYIALHQ